MYILGMVFLKIIAGTWVIYEIQLAALALCSWMMMPGRASFYKTAYTTQVISANFDMFILQIIHL